MIIIITVKYYSIVTIIIAYSYRDTANSERPRTSGLRAKG